MKKLGLLLIAVMGLSSAAYALSINIDVGDRGYYTHGPGYWDNGVYLVWVPGHRGPHGHWIHGHYARR